MYIMKILPILFEQDLGNVNTKLDYYIKHPDRVKDDTNQERLAFCVFFVYPLFSNKFNIPTTVAPLSIFSESLGLTTSDMDLYVNYLATLDDLKNNLAVGLNYDFIPKNWSIRLFVPVESYPHFVDSLGKIFKLGALIFLSQLNQELIDNLKKQSCKYISLLGRHIMTRKEVEIIEIEKIRDIIFNNPDCQFVLNTEIQELVDAVDQQDNVQICQDKSYWESRLY
jgi:hypothetical protein